MEGEFTEEFERLIKCSRKINIPRTTIDRKIKTNRLINNLIFKYVIYE